MKRTLLLFNVVKYLGSMNHQWKLINTNFDSNPKTVDITQDGVTNTFELNENGTMLMGEV